MINQRDMFEVEYIDRHLRKDVYAEAKEMMESLRNGATYDDEHVAEMFDRWILGLDW